MMASHCPAPSPLSTLDVLSLSLLPTSFSAVLFTDENGTAQVLKRTRDLRRIQEWMTDQDIVQVSGQCQPKHQPLTPAARSGLRALLPYDMEWLFHMGREVYLCCHRDDHWSFVGVVLALGRLPPPPPYMLESCHSESPVQTFQKPAALNMCSGSSRLFQNSSNQLNPLPWGLTQGPTHGPSMTSPTPPWVYKVTSRVGRTVHARHRTTSHLFLLPWPTKNMTAKCPIGGHPCFWDAVQIAAPLALHRALFTTFSFSGDIQEGPLARSCIS